MQIFNLGSIKTFPYEQRDKNVFFKTDEFKARIISLLPGKKIPECEFNLNTLCIIKNTIKDL